MMNNLLNNIIIIGLLLINYNSCLNTTQSKSGIKNMDKYELEYLEIARAAACNFCKEFKFKEKYLSKLQEPPVDGPIYLERDKDKFVVFRWLGGGRGDIYIQTEVNLKSKKITVYGGYSHQEFGPWSPN